MIKLGKIRKVLYIASFAKAVADISSITRDMSSSQNKSLDEIKAASENLDNQYKMIEQSKKDIKTARRKISREKSERLQNWEIAVQIIEADINAYQRVIEREQIMKHKLLNDPNEIKGKSAQELYDKYLKASEHERQRDLY